MVGHADHHDESFVHALLGGPRDRLFTFIEVTGQYLNELGVEMKVHTVPVSPEVLPLPAVRMPNSGHDIEDRFDKALDLLTEMRDGINEMRECLVRVERNQIVMISLLNRIVKNTDLLPAIKKNTDMLPAIKKNTDMLPAIKKNTDMLPAIKKNTDMLPEIKKNTDKLPEMKAVIADIRIEMLNRRN